MRGTLDTGKHEPTLAAENGIQALSNPIRQAHPRSPLRVAIVRGEPPSAPPSLFRGILDGYRATFAAWRKSQEQSASDFDLLDTLNIVGDELRHSMMLAWLLDHRIQRAGTHAQGSLGFQLFLEELDLDPIYAHTNYKVAREVHGEESRVDIEIAAPGSFIVHIEIKIFSKEGEDQTGREWRDLNRRATQLGVKPRHVHAVFITLTGEQSRSPRFTCLPWTRISGILDRFAEQAKAPEVRMFARHYARALRRITAEHTNTNETDDNDPQT